MLFEKLKKNLATDNSSLPARRLALLGDSATQFLTQAIKGYGVEEKIRFEVFETDFDQFNAQLLNPDSELYQWKPECIVLYACAEELWASFAELPGRERPSFAERVLSEIKMWR